MHKVTLIKGDGIGPSIMDAAVSVINAAGANRYGKELKPECPHLKEQEHLCRMLPCNQ